MSARSAALKARLKANETTFGAWLSISSPSVAEILAGSGFDWAMIDTEHGPFSLEGLQAALMAFKGATTVPLVRVPWNDHVHIKQALDMGVEGILIPMVNNAAEAKAAVAACKYPPEGERGFGPKRAADYGRSTDEYVRQANDSVIVIIQIEHIDAVERLEEILAVPGIDVICLGPTDLSGSAGVLRQFDHPKVVAAMERVVRLSREHGLPVSTGVTFGDAEMQRWAAKGANFVFVADDAGILRTGFTSALSHMRTLLG